MAQQTLAQRKANLKFARNEERKKGKSPAAAAKYSRTKAAKDTESSAPMPMGIIIFVAILLIGQAIYAGTR